MGNVFITGARRGIGKAVVEKFAQEGWNIWACASRQDDAFEEELGKLAETYQVWVKPVYFNLLDEKETGKAIRTVLKEKQPIDALINNAGIPNGGLMQMTSLDSLREVMEVNFVAQIHVIQLVSKAMMRQKSGSIVNMGSVGGIEAREGYLAYGASKAAFLWATRSISKELARYNIRVNAVAPGLIETDMGGFKTEEEKSKILGAISIKRMGTPQEVAQAVWFLASDASSFMTGSVLNVDGGRLI